MLLNTNIRIKFDKKKSSERTPSNIFNFFRILKCQTTGVDGDQADILHVQAMLNLRIGFTRKFAGELQNHYICVPTIRTTQGYMMKRLHFDMDNILVDFASGIAKLDAKTASKYEGRLDDVLGIFALMEPIPGAIETVHLLAKKTMSLFFL